MAFEPGSELQPRWRTAPLRQTALAWTGLLWAAPMVAAPAVLLGNDLHSFSHTIGRFFLLSSYNLLMFILTLSWTIVPLTLLGVYFSARRKAVLPFVFWSALLLAHLCRFVLANADASLFASGLTGPGIGPSLDVLCPPDVDASNEIKAACADLAVIEHSNFVVTALLSQLLFAFDAIRLKKSVKSSS